MAQAGGVEQYTGESGRQYATRFGDPTGDILGQCFVDRVGAWIATGDKVIEFGCGKGRNMLALNCRERAGYDVNEFSLAAAARAGLHVYRSTEEIPKAYWNVVVCNHVLEHVPAPITTLELLRSFLAPGGRLILTVPVEGHLFALRPAERDIDHHLYCWNPTTARNLLEVAGYKVGNIEVRSAACEDRAQILSRFSWRAFKLAVWTAGILLRRYEMTCVAEAP
jgi:SAM-dependent methyltransferase